MEIISSGTRSTKKTINKTNCPKIEKMHHLINSLEGEARRVVNHLGITVENYEDAI
jgi:Protein of unknown function (DUF1759)